MLGSRKGHKMSKNTRRDAMLEYIRSAKKATCEELSRYFGVTEETIRKDLNFLSEQGGVIRTFGGAALRETGGEMSMDQRKIQRYPQKQKIAAAAEKLIVTGDLVVMDAGSSMVMLAQAISEEKHIIAVTNSLEITNVLAHKPHVTVFCTGGKLRTKSMSFQGAHAENAIRSYNVNKAFITCTAVDWQRGIMDTNEDEVRVKLCMVNEAREVYLLADSSKIEGIAHVTTCDISRVTAIITDSEISADALEQFRAAGVRVIVAE